MRIEDSTPQPELRTEFTAPYSILGDNRYSVSAALMPNVSRPIHPTLRYIPGLKKNYTTVLTTQRISLNPQPDINGGFIELEWTVSLAAHQFSKRWTGSLRCELCTYFIDKEKAQQSWIDLNRPYTFTIVAGSFLSTIGLPLLRRPMPSVEARGALLVNLCIEQAYRVIKDYVSGVAFTVKLGFHVWQPDSLYKRPTGEIKTDLTIEVGEESGKIVDRDFD